MQTSHLTDAQIAGAARAAGFSGSAVTTITAIALAESGGNATAHNSVPPDDSYGLTQVNMIGKMGSDRRAEFGLKSNTDLYDPTTNMRVAYALSNGGKSFRAWTTYTTGAYLAFLPRASTASGSPADPPTGNGVSSGTAQDVGNPIPGADTLKAVSGFFSLITDPINWMRVGMMVAGAIGVLVGVALMAGASSQVQMAAGAAANFIPGGKAVMSAAKGAAK